MFWDRFSDLCLSVGKAPNTVAKELNIPSGSITAWRNGAEPRNKTIAKIAEYFGVSVNFLLGSEQKEKPTASSSEQLNLDSELIMRLCQLTQDEIQKVDAFVQGLLASR